MPTDVKKEMSNIVTKGIEKIVDKGAYLDEEEYAKIDE